MAVVTWFQDNWGKIAKAVKDAKPVILLPIKVMWRSIKTLFKVGWRVVSGVIRTAINLLTGDFAGAWKAIKETIVGVVGDIWTHIKETISDITDAFNVMWDQIVGNSIVPDMMAGIQSEFQRLDSVMVEPAMSATQEVTGGFQGMNQAPAGAMAGGGAGGGNVPVELTLERDGEEVAKKNMKANRRVNNRIRVTR